MSLPELEQIAQARTLYRQFRDAGDDRMNATLRLADHGGISRDLADRIAQEEDGDEPGQDEDEDDDDFGYDGDYDESDGEDDDDF